MHRQFHRTAELQPCDETQLGRCCADIVAVYTVAQVCHDVIEDPDLVDPWLLPRARKYCGIWCLGKELHNYDIILGVMTREEGLLHLAMIKTAHPF